MIRRLAFGKGMVVVPFGIVLLCQPSFASRLGSRLSTVSVAVLAPVAQVTRASAAFDPFASAQQPAAAVVLSDELLAEEGGLEGEGDLAAPGGTSAAKTGKTTSKQKATVGTKAKSLPSVRVPQAVVFRLARAGTRPSGVPVAASGNRPAGIQVFGVSALGIGVRDGDVLTHVSGVSVTQVGQVIALIIAARGARTPTISGKLWRGSRDYTLVVEQPYFREGEDKPPHQAVVSDDALSSEPTNPGRF